MRTPDRKPVTVEVETLIGVALHIGAGYGADPEWSHGQWKGRNWVDSKVYDLTDPAISARIPFGVIDHVARATCDGRGRLGAVRARHDRPPRPTGFKDWSLT